MVEAADFTDIADWPFAVAAKTALLANCTFNAPGGENEHTKRLRLGKIAGCYTAWTEMQRLATVRCKGCHGYGHPHKKCPTWKGIGQIGSASLIARNGLAQARNTVVVSQAAHR